MSKTQTVSVRIDSVSRKRLKTAAVKRGLTFIEMVREVAKGL